MIYAVINNNVIENVIIADEDFAQMIRQQNQYVLRVDNLNPEPSIGWTYDGSTFSPPEE